MSMTDQYGGMRINDIAHLTLPVSDLQEAERFYTEVLQIELVRRIDREVFVALQPQRAGELDGEHSPLHLELSVGGVELDLFLHPDGMRTGAPPPHPHVAFRVTPAELDDYKTRLQQHDVPTDGPRRLGPPGHASLYFTDPFGNLLELQTMGYAGPVEMGPPKLASLARKEDRA